MSDGLGSSLRDTQPGSAKTVADILAAAAEIVAKPGAWTQGAYGRRSQDSPEVLSVRTGATCFCAIGAIFVADTGADHIAAVEAGPAVAALRQVVGAGVPRWNDAPERTQAEVVAALRTAAEKDRTAAPSALGGDAEGVNQKGLPQ